MNTNEYNVWFVTYLHEQPKITTTAADLTPFTIIGTRYPLAFFLIEWN